jgi:hypothetical protein
MRGVSQKSAARIDSQADAGHKKILPEAILPEARAM